MVVRERDQVTATKLEIARLDKWQGTVSRARRLPVSWHDRCAALLRTRSQFTFATGTHCLSETKTHEEAITKLRSSVMRCLLRRDKYVATPHLLLSLVASPSLNPFYSRVMDGLMVAWRAMRFSGSSDEVKLLFQQGGGDFDGPVARLLQIDSMPDFKGCVRALFDLEPSQVGKWMHEVRDKWRLAQWKKLARDRAVFKGIEKGILREITTRYLRRLEREGSSGPFEAGGPAHEQARMKAVVLRLLLCGGLFTRDVISQHKFQTTTECDCAVGGTLDVFHVFMDMCSLCGATSAYFPSFSSNSPCQELFSLCDYRLQR